MEKKMCSAIAKMANDEIVAKMSYNTFELFDEKSYSNDVYIKNLLQIYERESRNENFGHYRSL